MTTDRTKAERALAFLVAQLRTEWAEPGILAALRKVSEHPLADVTAAALDCAVHRADQRSPAIIAMDGRHWTALDRMAGQDAAPPPPTQSVIVTYCAHGEPGSSCPECFPRTHHGALPTAEQRAAMRQAIADAKTETARLEIPREEAR